MTESASYPFSPSPPAASGSAGDVCTQGVQLLIHQFKTSPKLHALLCSFLERVQELEVAIDQVRNTRDLDTAVGEQLDVLGRIVGEGREGRDDDDYRRFLRVRILINKSTGTPEELIQATQLIVQPDSVYLDESFPAFITITASGGDAAVSADKVEQILQLMKPAGVGLRYVYTGVPPEEAFRFATGTTVETSAVHGFDAGKLGGTV